MKKSISRSLLAITTWAAAVPSFTRLVNAVADPAPIQLVPGSGPFAGIAGNANITPYEIVNLAITGVLVVAALIFFFILVMGGIKWIMSGGDKGNVETARKQITNALIGLAIIFVAWAIIRLLSQVFGVDILTLPIPRLPQP